MRYNLTLDYTLGEGWLAPWIEGLQKGKAVASTCSNCEAAQFPPLRNCPQCRSVSDGWKTLSGDAKFLHRTQGSDGDFALVKFDGAATATVVRADGLPQDCTIATLAPAKEDAPIMRLQQAAML